MWKLNWSTWYICMRQRKNLRPWLESNQWPRESLFIFIHLSLLSCCMFQETSISPIWKKGHCKEGLSKANVFDGKHKAKIEKKNIHVRGTDLFSTMHLDAKEEASKEMQLLTLHLFMFLAKEFTLEFTVDTSHLMAVTFIASCCSHWTSLRSINSP